MTSRVLTIPIPQRKQAGKKSGLAKACFFPILVFLFSSLSQPGALFAQDQRNETEVVRRETAAAKGAVRTAEKAKQKKEIETFKDVSFEQVLKDPDNVKLNFAFAQKQVSEGNLLGSASTLERILMVNPDLHEIRLFYTVVLYRLDNLTEAERELETLSKIKLPSALQSEADLYRKQIKRRKRKTHMDVRESVGWEYDTNRNASPSTKHVLFGEVPLDTSGTTIRRSDTSFLNITSVDVTHDLPFQAGHQLIGSFTYFLQEQSNINSLDLGSFQYELGGVYKNDIVNFTPTFFASHVYLSDENYLRTQGGNFLFDHSFKNRLDVFANTRYEYQDYLKIHENNVANERNGAEVTLSTGAAYTLTPSQRISAAIGYGRKNAKAHYEGYDKFLIKIFHTLLLPKGQFVINSIDNNYNYYDVPDTAIAGRHRKDTDFRYRLSYGAPLTALLIGKILPGPFKDIVLTTSYEVFRSLSTIENYSYTNHKFQTLLTKKWEF